jgi:NAD(P) transhydrogenase subunit alpha
VGSVLPEFFALLTVFILAIFIGFEVISKVPATLHTPLMSATNAIHGVVLVGAMLATATFFAGGAPSTLLVILGVAAVTLGTINVVGGFAVTERMLQMFRKREIKK